MGVFEDIPIRSNADDENVSASWWNIIRSKLITAFPSFEVPTSAFTIANNQSTQQDVTGLSVDSSDYHYYKYRYEVSRSDDTPKTQEEVGYLEAFYDGSSWSTIRTISFGNALGDGTEAGTGVTTDYLGFDSSTGQAKYKSSNFTGGSYEGSLLWSLVEVRLPQS